MSRNKEADKKRIQQTLDRIAAARDDADKRPYRSKANRSLKVYRKPDGTFNMGGWRGQPGSLAALDLHREPTQIGGPVLPRCWCGQPAVRGSDECRLHGGKNVLAARRRRDHTWKPKRVHVRVRELRNLMNMGMVPPGLNGVPAFREAADVVLNPPPDIPRGSPEWAQRARYWQACARLAIQFVVAWHAMVDDDDHVPWQAAVANARAMGLL